MPFDLTCFFFFTSYRKLRLEYYNCITGACGPGLCAKTKNGLGAGGSRNSWNEKGRVLRVSGHNLA